MKLITQHPKSILLAALLLLLSPQSGRACSPADLPDGIRQYLTRNFPDWKIVEESDLLPEDRAQWSKRHAEDCPGFIAGRFVPIKEPVYAVVLIPKVPAPHRTKLLVFRKRRQTYTVRTLLELQEATSPVIFTMPAGTYESWDQSQKVRTKRPVIFYVHYEASTVMFYWAKGKFRKLQLLD